MVTQNTGEPLDVLQQQQGAQMIYRVTQQESRVRLEGRAGCRTCLFEAEKPDGAARILLGDGPRYTLVTQPALAPASSAEVREPEASTTLPWTPSRSWTA
jgi:hypothetical protein